MYTLIKRLASLAKGPGRGDLLRVTSLIVLLYITFSLDPSYTSAQTMVAAASGHTSAYEVASIRPSSANATDAGQIAINGNLFTATNFSAHDLVYLAYNIPTDDLISQLPGWATSARFDLQARLENKGSEKGEMERSRLILRELLTDRFQFKFHYEERDRRVYALTTGKHGAKLHEANAGDGLEISLMKGDIHLRAAKISLLVEGISMMLGRPVIDKTGLLGRYNIDLKCAPDELSDTTDSVPSLPRALREQLGLQVLSIVSPMNVLIVDQLNRPSLN